MSDEMIDIKMTKRQGNITAYALAFYAQSLIEADFHTPYDGPLETAPEVHAIEGMVRRAVWRLSLPRCTSACDEMHTFKAPCEQAL